MKNLYKALIVWLLLVAIPFQGFAAASMATGAPAPVPASMTAEHCAQMGTMVHHDDGVQSSGSGHIKPHHHSSGKCNTCASCCIGVAIAPPVPTVQAPGDTPALAAFHFALGHVARVDLALPERPPKTSLT